MRLTEPDKRKKAPVNRKLLQQIMDGLYWWLASSWRRESEITFFSTCFWDFC
jgi:hypothetical protein